MKKQPNYKLKLFGPTAEARAVKQAKDDADLVAYLRVSTSKQEERYGLPSQLATVERWSMAQGRQVAEIFTDAISGTTETRDGLDSLRRAIAEGRVGEVAVLDLGRLARDFRVGDELYDELSKDVTVTSVTEGTFTDDYQSTFIRRVFQAAHEMDRKKILERLSDGKTAAVVDDGRWAGGWGCFGYRSVGEGMIVIIDAEADVIVLIFELMVECVSDSGIAKELNRRGIKTMTGLAWDHHSVSQVTRKFTFYAATTTNWYDVESKKIAHEAILSPDLIARVEDHLRPHPDLITTAQAAKLAGVCRLTIERWRKAGIIEAKVVKRKNLGLGEDGNGGSTAKYYFDPEQIKAVRPQQGVKLDTMPRPPRTPKVRLAGEDRTPTPPGKLTVLQAAERLGCSAPTVRMMVEHGELDLAGTYTLHNGLKGWLLDETQVLALPPRTGTHRLRGEAHPAALKPYIPPLPARTQAKLDAQMAAAN